MKTSIAEIARADGRYKPAAFEFVHEGLGFAVRSRSKDGEDNQGPRHISGRELCLALAELGKMKWGYLAKMVLNDFGVQNTMDFGQIVYLMIEHKWLYARPEDTIEEFDNVYKFTEAFEKNYQFSKTAAK